MAFETTEDVVKYIKDNDVEYVDMRFTDVPGTEQRMTIPAHTFTEEAAEEGFAFDGSSVIGFTSIDESDMNLHPDVATAHVDRSVRGVVLLARGWGLRGCIWRRGRLVAVCPSTSGGAGG